MESLSNQNDKQDGDDIEQSGKSSTNDAVDGPAKSCTTKRMVESHQKSYQWEFQDPKLKVR